MEVRIKRIFYEELEEIMEDISDKIAEISEIENETQYHKDRIRALQLLYYRLEQMEGLTK